MPGRVEERGVEEDRIPLRQRQLDEVSVEVRAELRSPEGEVAGLVLLRVRQVHRRAALDRHVAVGNGALEGQDPRQAVDVRGVLSGDLRRQEAQVVVAVSSLGGPTGVHHVDLGGDLVCRAQPGRRNQGDDLVGIVIGEGLGRADGHLLQGVPDPVVCAWLGEVVARGRARRTLIGDQGIEDFRGPVDDLEVRKGSLDHHDAGTVRERPDHFSLHFAAAFRIGRKRAQPIAIVERNIPIDRVGQRVVTPIGHVLDQGAEGIQVAISLGQPRPGSSSGDRHRVLRCAAVRTTGGGWSASVRRSYPHVGRPSESPVPRPAMFVLFERRAKIVAEEERWATSKQTSMSASRMRREPQPGYLPSSASRWP